MADPTAQPKLQSDPRNANKGTVRGLGMVERSLQSYGAMNHPMSFGTPHVVQ
ncbi:MAG: hypothetical protein ACR2OE_15540 [Thermomicrobiales bacterium]